jgi:4-amino-4-deoxy-L-arabinose transferase-like glycosyltransferase
MKDKETIAKSGVWWRRHPRTILVLVTLACLLPFADKAFHIDDSLFIWADHHMQTHWGDPYGFDVNWYGWSMPMHEVTKNPPLACAYIALIGSIFGENEFALHLGFFAQAIAAVLGTYELARRLCDRPLQAALAVLFTPVFLVSSTTVMCDVLMVALWVWAVAVWMRGLESNQPLTLTLAGLLAGACVMAKYFGITLILLLLAYSLARKRRVGWRLLYLLIPIVIVLLYEYWTRALYGHGLLLDAFSYTNQAEPRTISGLFFKVLTAVGFIGGCCAIALVLAPLLWRRKSWVWAGVVVAILLVASWVMLGNLPAYADRPARLGIAFQCGLLILGGLVVLALPLLDWRRHKNAESLLLLLWVLGTFLFCILNWTVNARSILPMVPAVAILLFRRVETVASSSMKLTWFFAAAALLSLLVSLADYQLANSARAAAMTIKGTFSNSSAATVWFQGHWGFQYYAQASGLRAFDSAHSQVLPGDLMVLPFNNTNLIPIPKDRAERLTVIELPVFPCVSTMSKAVGAGFYMDLLGPLPFAFGAVPTEKYYILRFK